MLRLTKQLICFALGAVFLLQAFNSTIVLSNYEINKDFITKMFCINKSKPKLHCNGKCHLKKELKKAEEKEKSPINPINEKNEIQFFSGTNSAIAIVYATVVNYSNVFSDYSYRLSDKHIYAIFHPPQV